MQLEGVGPFKHIVRSEGLRGLYRGILPESCIVVPGVGIVFMTYETLKELLLDWPSQKIKTQSM